MVMTLFIGAMNKLFLIKTPSGPVAGFSSQHQIVQRAGHPDFAKLFKTATAAAKWASKYADAGYGLVTGQFEVVEA